MPRGKRQEYRCSFCGKAQEQVLHLIAGPGAIYICDECVDLCQEIVAEQRAALADRSAQERVEMTAWPGGEDTELIQRARQGLTDVLARFDRRLRSVEHRLEEIEKKL